MRLVCSVLVFSSRIRVLLYSSITSSVQSLVATSKTNCTLVLHRAYKVWWLCLKQTACTLEGIFFRRLVDCFRADWAPHRRSHAGCLLEAYPSGQIFSAMEAEGWLKGASAAEGWLKSEKFRRQYLGAA